MRTTPAAWLLILAGCGDGGGGGSGSVAPTQNLMVRVDEVRAEGHPIGQNGSTPGDHVDISGTAWRFYATSILTWKNLSTGASGGADWLYALTTTTDNIPGTILWQMTVPLAPGPNRIVIRAYDPFDRYLPDQAELEPRRTLDVRVTEPVPVQWMNLLSVSVGGSTLDLQGTAGPGDIVTSVSWRNETTGQEGVASGTATWTASIPLLAGVNYVVVTAHSPVTSGYVRIEVHH